MPTTLRLPTETGSIRRRHFRNKPEISGFQWPPAQNQIHSFQLLLRNEHLVKNNGRPERRMDPLCPLWPWGQHPIADPPPLRPGRWGTGTWCPAVLSRRRRPLPHCPMLLVAHRALGMPADPTGMLSFLLESHCSTFQVQHTMHSPAPARQAPRDCGRGRWCSPTPLPSPRALASF